MFTLSFVRPLFVGATWPLIRDYVQGVCDISGGRYTPAGTLRKLLEDRASLWVINDDKGEVIAFLTTRVTHYDAVTMLCVEMVGGEEIDTWLTDENMETLIQFAMDNGCDGIEGHGRGLAWARKMKAYGWKQFSTSIELRFDKEE